MVAIWQEKETGFVIIDYMDESVFDGISMRETIRKRASMAIPDQKVLCRIHEGTLFGQTDVSLHDLQLAAEWTKCQATLVYDKSLYEELQPMLKKVQSSYPLYFFNDEAEARAWLDSQD